MAAVRSALPLCAAGVALGSAAPEACAAAGGAARTCQPGWESETTSLLQTAAGGAALQAAAQQEQEDLLFSKWKEDKECLPNGAANEKKLGVFDTVKECQDKCIEEYGSECNYFIYGKGAPSEHHCWWESTDACESGGFEDETGVYDIWKRDVFLTPAPTPAPTDLPNWKPAKKGELKFQRDLTFKIVQFTDLHYGEARNCERTGDENDIKNDRLQEKILEAEHPDLVVFSGDVITGDCMEGNHTAYWDMATRVVREKGIPWASILGNHDTAWKGGVCNRCGNSGYAPDYKGYRDARHLLMARDIELGSLSQRSPDSVNGASNFVLTVNSAASEEPKLQLIFVDTGGGTDGNNGLGQGMDDSQVAWYDETMTKKRKEAGAHLPAMLYHHIPLPEMAAAGVQLPAAGDDCQERGPLTEKCSGVKGEKVCPYPWPSNFSFSLLESREIFATFTGHDHYNYFCCPTFLPFLNLHTQGCYGRHSGYGGYWRGARGARVVGLREADDFSGRLTADTWIRFEDGSEDHRAAFDVPLPRPLKPKASPPTAAPAPQPTAAPAPQPTSAPTPKPGPAEGACCYWGHGCDDPGRACNPHPHYCNFEDKCTSKCSGKFFCKYSGGEKNDS